MQIRLYRQVAILLLLVLPGVAPAADEGEALPLKAFIEKATQFDTVFEEILMERLTLRYRRDLILPTRDIILSLKSRYNVFIDQERSDPDLTLSLDKLFLDTGTRVSLSYDRAPSPFEDSSDSGLQFLISQPIAENAFGRGNRLLDQIVGVENDVIRYQIVEAYEDYLASLTATYYNWYSAWENLRVGKASHVSNLKLLENIRERQRQKIALPIDVNKMMLLVTGKQENLIILQETYDNLANLVSKAIRLPAGTRVYPVNPADNSNTDVAFERDYNSFTDSSRTYRVLRLLEDRTGLEVKKQADELLPSTNLLLGYRVAGEDWGIREKDRIYFAGVSIDWPLQNTVDRARHEVAKIEQKKTALSNKNKYEELRVNLKNLFLQIRREQELVSVAHKKIGLAEAILRDEAENYSFGKVTLNDYLDAVNRVDEARFSLISHNVALNKLMIEWLRLTDRLVDEKTLPVHDKADGTPAG